MKRLSQMSERELEATLSERVDRWRKDTSRLITPRTFPEPEDRGQVTASDLAELSYVDDLIRPGRITVVAAEEGTGKSYALHELGVRVTAAGGAFAETWAIQTPAPVLILSEQHGDDDYRYESDILLALGRDRADLSNRYYRLPLMTAAAEDPALVAADWRAWITGWMRDHDVRVLVVDTATSATQVDPWGKDIQAVYRGLRIMLADYPELAVVLVVHMSKPKNGGGERKLSAVLGEWARWCDIVLLMEAEGEDRTKLTLRKRVRHQRRIVTSKRGGLLVEPADIEGSGPKVPLATVVATVADRPGLSQGELAAALGVAESTVRGYLKAAIRGGQVEVRKAESGLGKAIYPVEAEGAGVRPGAMSVPHPHRTPPKGEEAVQGVRGAGAYIYAPPRTAPSEETEEDLIEQAAAYRFGTEPEPEP